MGAGRKAMPKFKTSYEDVGHGVVATTVGELDGLQVRARCFQPYPDDAVEGIFGDIAGAIAGGVRSIARNKTFRSIASTALDVAATVVPGGGIAKAALGIAGRALGGAGGGGGGRGGAAPSAPPRSTTPTRARGPRRNWLVNPKPGFINRQSLMRRQAQGMARRQAAARRGRLPSAEQLRQLRPILSILPRVDRQRIVRAWLGMASR